MKLSSREKIIGFVLLGVFLIWLFVIIFGRKVPSSGFVDPRELLMSNKASDKETTMLEDFDLEKFITHIELDMQAVEISTARDPFKKFNPHAQAKDAPVGVSELHLGGIIFEDDQEPVALINEEILHEGDFVSGFEIQVIRQNEVVLRRGEEKYTLELFLDVDQN